MKGTPLEVAEAIAARFLRIPRESLDYMYHVGLAGLLDLYGATREQKYLDCYLSYLGDKPRFDFWLYRATGDDRWLTGVADQAEAFLRDPRRDREGALLDPRGRYTVDGFSGIFKLPVLFGHVLRDHRFFDEALRQFGIHEGYVWDPVSGVWFSRWGHGLHPSRNNPGLWARGNGWLAEAWGRTMHFWDPAHPGYPVILAKWQRFCQSLAAFQTPSGLFRQLLNRADCFEEASGSGLFCSAFGWGARHGTLPASFASVSWRTFCGLAELVDDSGGIHNVSCYAGGYNFERQYYSCARHNDPHGDGTVMKGCVAVHELLCSGVSFDQTPPVGRPTLVTRSVAGSVTTAPPVHRAAVEIAPPVLARTLALASLPSGDRHGDTVQGLLDWHGATRDEAAGAHARRLFDACAGSLPPVVRWSLELGLGACEGRPAPVSGLCSFVDAERAAAERDRTGLVLDPAGGYSVHSLYPWLPLLARAGALSGERRYFDEAVSQLFGHQRWLEDPITRLWHSAFGHGANTRRVSPGLWALGNGYVLAAACGVLEHLPEDHPERVEVLLFIRRLVESLHEYLPVFGGYSQILTDPRSFRCAAATGLLAAGLNRAVFKGWVRPEYYGCAYGAIWAAGELVDPAGHFRGVSRPEGACDTLGEWEAHRSDDDPAALGLILMACAQGLRCETSGVRYDSADQRLGGR